MRRASWCSHFAVLLVLALPVVAQDGTRDGRIIQSPVGESGSYIVEFRDPPILAASSVSAARAAAGVAVSQRLAAFERDLQRIGPDSRITQRYSCVFAGAAVSASGEAIRRIAALDYVRGVHVDRPIRALLDDSLAKINAPQVWAMFGTRGDGIVVAIIDTGIDYNHPAFGGGFGPGHRVAGGWDFVHNDADPIDDAGHGTHVAGIVGGNGGGVTGIAPGVTFLAYKVLDSQGQGSASAILAGIERAADPNGDGDPSDHADVVNMSLGGEPVPDDPLVKAVETATAAGVIFAIAAGNSGDFRTISSPATAPSAIAVGATTIDDQIASFSSKGPDIAMEIKPEVVAPGVNIVSAKAGGGTLSASGTSMATPHVAGVAALLRAIHRNWSPADVKAAIVETAIALGNDVMAEGSGRIDAWRAANADVLALPSTMTFGRDDPSIAHWTATQTFKIVNRGAATQTINLGSSSSRTEVSTHLDATTATLAPGESRDIHVFVDVDNAKLPVPVEGSLAFSGEVTIAGGAIPIHIPWAFVRAALVTLDYDGNEPYEAFVASTHSLAFGHLLADIAQHESTVVVPAGEYDVKLITFPQKAIDHRLFVIERQSITDVATIPIHRDSAANQIIFAPVDPAGRSVPSAIGGTGSCHDNLVVMWPNGSALAMSSLPKSRTDQLFVSALSDRFTLLPLQYCFSVFTHTVYAAQTTPLHGINAPVTATVDTSLWTRVPVHITFPSAVKNPGVSLATGFLWRGPNWTLTSLIGATKPEQSSWDGTIFITREQHPALNVTAEVQVDDNIGNGPPLPIAALSTGYIRHTDQGVSLWPYLTNSPVTYVAHAEDPLSFGDGAPTPLTSIWMEGANLRAGVRFVGALDEQRNVEASDATFALRNQDGNVVSAESLPPGAYAFEVTKPLLLFGVPGELRMVAAFDTRRDDGAPPALTALRLLDANDRVTSQFTANAPGTLIFSAIDVSVTSDHFERRLVRADATTVRWRSYGTTDWKPLALSVVGSEVANGQAELNALGHVPTGTTFRVDLSPATRFGPQLIDLSFHLEDFAGNTLEYTLEPAFSVIERRRASRP